MELFTVGIGNYSEQDIREAARAFTGYRVDMSTQQFRFAAFQQDRGNKTFMGQGGPLNGDDIIDVVVRQPACARFIGRKLWRFFAEDEPSEQVVDAVATSLRKHNFEIRPVLREIFSSAEFYDERVDAVADQKPGPVFGADDPTTAICPARFRRCAKRDPADGADAVRAAQC